MAESRIKLKGEDAASAVVHLVGQSIGEITAEAVKAGKAVSDLHKELKEAVNKGQTGSIAAISAQLDEAIPRLQAAKLELRNGLKPALNETGGFFGDLGSRVAATAAGFLTAEAAIGVVTGGFRMMTGFVRESGQSFAEAEAAQKTLSVALRAQGMASPELIAQYNDLSVQMQKTTVVSDDMSTKMQGLLVQVGNVMPSQMEAALKASADLSAGLGIDLESATQLVAKAAAGHTETLGRYGVRVDEAKLKSEGFSAVLQAVNGQFGGQAAAQLETYSGRLQQIANNWDNAKEAVGGAILLDPKLQLLMRTLAEGSEAGADGAERLSGKLNALIEGGLRMLPVVGGPAASTLHALSLAADEANKAAAEQSEMMRLAAAGTKDFHIAKTAELDVSTMLWRVKEAGREQDEQAADAKRRAVEAQRKYTEETRRFGETLTDVLTRATGYEAVIDTIDGNVVDAIRHYDEQGVSLSAVAKVYELTEAQVWALGEAEKAEQAMLANLTAGNQELARALSARNQAQRESQELMEEARGLTPLGVNLPSGANPQLEAIRNRFSVGLTETLQQDLPASIMRAIEGGGSVFEAAGSTMGSFLVSEKGFGTELSAGLTSIFGKGISTAIDTMLPGIGSLMGPLLNKIARELADAFGGPSEQELAGRGIVADFEKRYASTADMINTVAEAYRANGKTAEAARAAIERMWAAEKLGADATREALAAINEELKRHQEVADAVGQFQSQDQITHAADIANAAYQQMVAAGGQFTKTQIEEAYRDYQELLAQLEGAAGDAARAWLEVHDAAAGTTSAASKAISDLQRQRDELAGSYANEAAEAEMGSIERDARANVARLEAQMQGQQEAVQANTAQAAEAAATIENEFSSCWERVGEDGQSTADAVRDYFANLDLVVPIRFDYERPEFPGVPPAPSYANEGFDLTRPHLARIGDAPSDSESVLRAQTVRDIVRASRNAGASQALEGGRSGGVSLAGLQAAMQQLVDTVRVSAGAALPVVRITIPIDGRVVGEAVIDLAKDDKYGLGTGFRSLQTGGRA